MKQRLYRIAFALLSIAQLTGCPASVPQVLSPVPKTLEVQPVDEYGTLQLRVKWPTRRISGFNTQLIPTTTNALVVWVTDGANLLKKEVISRAGDDAATASIRLKAANNLSVQVKAYRETTPDTETAVAIAQGSANANITRSRVTNASVTLDATFVPQIVSISSNVGKAGDTITINGVNFGESGLPIEVSFNGALAAAETLTRTSSTSLTVTVPAGATTGFVKVKADGVPSLSNIAYWVPETLEIQAPKHSWDPRPEADQRTILLGETLSFSETHFWKAKPEGSFDQYGIAPNPAWHTTNESLGNLDLFGTYRSASANPSNQTATITATLGSVTSNAITVHPEGVSVTMNPPSHALGGKGLAVIPLCALNVFSSGATSDLVAFSSNRDFIGIEGGKAKAFDFSGGGSAVVTATSLIDPTQQATASFELMNFTTALLAGSTQAVDDGPLTSAKFYSPAAMARDLDGTLYVADGMFGDKIRKITPGGVTTLNVSTDIGSDNRPQSLAIAPYGTLYMASILGAYTVDKSTGAADHIVGGNLGGYRDDEGVYAEFGWIEGLAAGAGPHDIFAADRTNHCIRRISSYGSAQTYAGNGLAGDVDSFGLLAQLNSPTHLTMDGAGNLFVWDRGNAKLKKVAPPFGTVTTICTLTPDIQLCGLAVDAQGMLYAPYIRTDGVQRHGILKITPDGQAFTIAGGGEAGYLEAVGTSAKFNFNGSERVGITITPTGEIFLTDPGNYRIRRLY